MTDQSFTFSFTLNHLSFTIYFMYPQRGKPWVGAIATYSAGIHLAPSAVSPLFYIFFQLVRCRTLSQRVRGSTPAKGPN